MFCKRLSQIRVKLWNGKIKFGQTTDMFSLLENAIHRLQINIFVNIIKKIEVN